MELQKAAESRELVDPRTALDEVDRLAVAFAGDRQVEALVEATRAVLKMTTAPGPVDVDGLRRMFENLSQMAGEQANPLMELMPDYLDAVQSFQHGGDLPATRARFAEILKRSEGLPNSALGQQLTAHIALVSELMGSLDDSMPDRDETAHDRRPEAARKIADRPSATDAERAMGLLAAGTAALNRGEEQDVGRINEGIADLREAVKLSSDQPEHVMHLAGLALALYHRSLVTGSLGDVDEAIAVLEEARKLARGPADPQWSMVTELLSQFRRRRGESSSSSPAGLDALRGHAWQVLLQPDPGSARTTARKAAQDAVDEAGRRLVDHEPEGALRALDAGRGLLLFAATELRDPCTRLTQAGERGLADRWRSEEQPSAWLRDDVIEVLSRETDLLDPPTLEEIQEALGRLGADALVYLVPATAAMPGWAVIAPAEGTPRYLALPNLVIDDGMEIERYLAAAAGRDAARLRNSRDFETVELTDFVESLEALCGWAWKAAIGPIVKPYLEHASDRTPRLVLIPMGDLARVPWQAARRPDGTYLVELAAVSQAASARMLCASAAAGPVRQTATGLIVADPVTGKPTSDLLSARLEAYAIHRTFYPGATYVGRRPDGTVSGSGAGTPDEVRNWLRADGSHAGTMLHFATHGDMTTDPARASSRLLLAGGDLTAEELIRTLDADRHPIGLVVLAGCHTGQSIHGYDEAYSLGTLFLASGARTVLSTQWSIPDQDTSLLMYMFHHFLSTERRPPGDALRLAQLWMLDDARKPPRDMPAPLRRMLADADPARITSWAGFVHWGQ
ncbi:CHAT domain-containing protein [Kribbella sp. VKM Ac-2569]|uniref:CHAT domain-containing protein n=1 Tax=Kribbella sp. VKM Ac-2569 TaxID=2512220 RepID=UPI0013003A0C|nr:CHAT domain-containing protein [Kribbella sp. VKM Ac-2569]